MTVLLNAPAWANRPDRDANGWSLAHTYVEDDGEDPGCARPVQKMCLRDLDDSISEADALASDFWLGRIRSHMVAGDLGLAPLDDHESIC